MKIILAFFLFISILTTSFAQNWASFTTIDIQNTELFAFNDKLFAAGRFTRIDGRSAMGIAYWNDKKWKTFITDSLPYTSVRSLVEYKNNLYAFGKRSSSSQFGDVIKYDESEDTWVAIPNSQVSVYAGNGIYESGTINHAIEFHGDLYVAGEFDFIGDKEVKNLAKWNGIEWEGIPIWVEDITAFEVFENKLFFSGVIDGTLTQSFKSVASWDGEKLDNIDGGISPPNFPLNYNSIYDLEVYNGKLYACGRRSYIPENEDEYFNVFKWDGQNWTGVKGFEANEFQMTALIKFGDYLVVGGASFADKAFIYNGKTVLEIEQETNNEISSFEIYKKELFANAGIGSNSIASGIIKLERLNELVDLKLDFSLFPNPTSGYLMVGYQTIYSTKTIISIFNSSGSLLREETFNDLEGIYLREFDVKKLLPGSYVIKIQSKSNNKSKKFIKL